MCLQDSVKILRNRNIQSWCYWRQQTQGGDTPCGGRHCQVQAGEPHHVRLGNQGEARHRWSLSSRRSSQRVQHQQDRQEQGGGEGLQERVR